MCLELLDENGIMFVTAPHRPKDWRPGAPFELWEKWSYTYVPSHLQYFSEKAIGICARKAGLGVSFFEASAEEGQAFEAWLRKAPAKSPIAGTQQSPDPVSDTAQSAAAAPAPDTSIAPQHDKVRQMLGGNSYEDKIKFERDFFDAEYYDRETLIETVPEALAYIHDQFDRRMAGVLGRPPWDYLIACINAVKRPRILSIGSGPCGTEIYIAKQLTGEYECDCLDINWKVLDLGMTKAAEQGLNLSFIVQDANYLKLEKEYDFVIAAGALHHLVNLEHVLQEVHDHLSPRGVFFTHEGTLRNGMLLWPETKKVVNTLMRVIPEHFRYDFSDAQNIVLRSEYPERDISEDGFECIRSQDLIPLLEQYFDVVHRFDGYAFVRRFVDRPFGPNYDLSRPLDKTILDLLVAFDRLMLSRGLLKPEGVFYILKRKTGGVASASETYARVFPAPGPNPAEEGKARQATVMFGDGFHPDEGGWRWMGGVGHMRVPSEMLPAEVSFKLRCGPAEHYARFPFRARVSGGAGPVQDVHFNQSEQTRPVRLTLRKSVSDARIRIESTEYYVPRQCGINDDGRELSVRLSDLELVRSE